jgi:multiple sugar transport system permease protein
MRRLIGTFRFLEPYLYLLPTIIGLLLFTAGAVAASFLVSFTQWDLVSAPRWIWLDNYANLLDSELFWKVFWNTLYFTILAVPF